MAPGGEMIRYPPHFGEYVLRHGSHEWLPYSKDDVRLKSSNNTFSDSCVKSTNVIYSTEKEPELWPSQPVN